MSNDGGASVYRVRVGDLNYGAHMGNEVALLVFQDARIDLLTRGGFSEADVGEGAGLVVAEASVRYRREVLLGDVLRTTVTPGAVRGARFELAYTVERDGDGATVLEGSTRMAAVRGGRACSVPDGLRAFLEGAAG